MEDLLKVSRGQILQIELLNDLLDTLHKAVGTDPENIGIQCAGLLVVKLEPSGKLSISRRDIACLCYR